MLPVDHIGIAVKDGKIIENLLDELVNSGSSLPEDIDLQGVRVRFYGRDTRLETLESFRVDSAVAKHLEKRGEGLHHVAFRVTDAQLQLERMARAGFRPLTDTPIPGAGGKSIFFLHPKDTCGILFEFCQPHQQYSVQFISCTELEKMMRSTGYCTSDENSLRHVVTSEELPARCQSLVVHNASFKIWNQRPDPPSVPTLISEVSTASHSAQSLQVLWPNAHLVVLPENSQPECLPPVLINFWSSLENE